ncbi:hypothetical protein HDR61_05560 [bacterium]|nr:hypothetical protein [bacterium]
MEIIDSTRVLNEVVVTGSNVAVGRDRLPYTVSTVSGKQLEATGNTQLYNAFPFMFPTSQNSAITEVMSDRPKKLQGIYTLDGRKVEKADKGIYIIDGKRNATR